MLTPEGHGTHHIQRVFVVNRLTGDTNSALFGIAIIRAAVDHKRPAGVAVFEGWPDHRASVASLSKATWKRQISSGYALSSNERCHAARRMLDGLLRHPINLDDHSALIPAVLMVFAQNSVSFLTSASSAAGAM